MRDVRASVAFMQDVCRSVSGMSVCGSGCSGRPGSPSSPSSGPRRSWATGWSPSPRAIRSGPQLFAEKHGVERVLASYDDVINDPEVDVVYNPLANSLHAPWNLAAVAAGKPVLTEKPFARNRAEAQQVAAAAEAAGVTVMEGFHYLLPSGDPPSAGTGAATARSATCTMSRCGWRMPAPERRRSAVVAGVGRRRADGPGLLRPARHAAARAIRRSSRAHAERAQPRASTHGATSSSRSPAARPV